MEIAFVLLQIQRMGHGSIEMFARGKAMTEADALRFMRNMVVVNELMVEKLVDSNYGPKNAYVEITERGRKFLTDATREQVDL